MRILVVGAGATGGAFGARLQEAGRDVTFLVRPKRAGKLRRDGLRFISPEDDRTLPVHVLTADEDADPFDLVIIAVKATGLETALQDATPFIGSGTTVLPFLNGMRHVDLIRALPVGVPLGGLVKIVATLDGEDSVVQMTSLATMTIGTFDGAPVPEALLDLLRVPGVDLTESGNVLHALWDKWAFIAAAGVVTCLFRNSVGNILEAGGRDHIQAAIAETEAVARAAGYPTTDAGHQQSVGLLMEPGSAFTSSLYRDVAAGNATESEHILGDLQARARRLAVDTPLLDVTLVQIRAGELKVHDAGA
ncbi:ketopantoate reductase family protein [Arthrobacter rhombi]|uniref:ketopantoate reductase family protein n=1 Tax=Arthrobacter rhombi TaxID=71253 RepID=UPI0031D3665E